MRHMRNCAWMQSKWRKQREVFTRFTRVCHTEVTLAWRSEAFSLDSNIVQRSTRSTCSTVKLLFELQLVRCREIWCKANHGTLQSRFKTNCKQRKAWSAIPCESLETNSVVARKENMASWRQDESDQSTFSFLLERNPSWLRHPKTLARADQIASHRSVEDAEAVLHG